ncbi:Bulb-type lectin domain [Dillenia turbinata]|uniref:Receptor-like serine/threonine-protein kinase n=1 Tax=Dillenia turbinata TaxID=194707 RepID=A0AAN8YZN8_9MAGN
MRWSIDILSVLVLTRLTSLFPVCTFGDRIVPGKSLTPNQTIVSAGGTFALGFFTPGNSSKSFVGIWYNDISQQTVIWVANREYPLAQNPENSFTVGSDGNFVVFDGEGNAVWSSNVSTFNFAHNNTVGTLLDSGNLVLRVDNDENILWQSFDHLCDNFLPGMKMSLNKKTHLQTKITSWVDEENPQPGMFSYAIDHRGPLQTFIWRHNEPYCRSSVWDGGMYQVNLDSSGKYAAYLTAGVNGDDYYFSFSVSEDSFKLRFRLLPNGKVQLLEWRENGWFVMSEYPVIGCDFYGRCGPNAGCMQNGSSMKCECLTGFKPKNRKEWGLGNWSEGCVAQKVLQCGNGDVFLRFGGMKLPDNSIRFGNMISSECENACLQNCSCAAYAYGSSSAASKCLHWVGDLFDIVQNFTNGKDLFVRVHGSELGVFESSTDSDLMSFEVSSNETGRNKNKVLYVVAAIIVLILLLLLALLVFLWWRKKVVKQGLLRGSASRTTQTTDETYGVDIGRKTENDLLSFSYQSLLAATENFSESNKLGEGGFGPVYKLDILTLLQGILSGNQVIAIKRLSRKSNQGHEEFMNECKLIAKLQHRNLVRLLGCCFQQEEKLLVYEFLPNRSLDKFIFGTLIISLAKLFVLGWFNGNPSEQAKLDWSKRFQIIEGIAQGLLYLHKYSRLKVIHRDIKASNVLLDEALNPKISDFGMARIFGTNQTEASTDRVVGTFGYMSPEYALKGHFSEKSDVFSFGVLLLEIVSGKRNTGFYHDDGPQTLLQWAWELWREDRAVELTDPSIRETCCLHEVVKCVHLGLLCVQESALDRPTMASVVHLLGNDTRMLPSPREPGFVRIFKNSDSPQRFSCYSKNEVITSSLEAR